MRIGFIGAGRVGTAFGIYLKKNGFELSGYSSRTEDSGLLAAQKTKSRYYSDFTQLSDDSDILFITTTDNQIEFMVNRLCSSSRLRQGQLIAHMSGALPSTILNPAKAFGCYVYSLHPLQAFADVDKAVSDLSYSSFCLEGDEEKISIFETLLQTCKNSYFRLKPEQKTLYHASACMVSNYMVTLIHNSLKLMESIGIDNVTALKAMFPLIDSTLLNISEFGTADALTGPIARGDIGTVARQLDAISSSCKEQLKLYTVMSEETVKLAELSKLKHSGYTKELEHLIQSYT